MIIVLGYLLYYIIIFYVYKKNIYDRCKYGKFIQNYDVFIGFITNVHRSLIATVIQIEIIVKSKHFNIFKPILFFRIKLPFSHF